jgi:hypothetical protein
MIHETAIEHNTSPFRVKDICVSAVDVKESSQENILGRTDSADCAINLSKDRHLLDVLAATNRCGSAVNFTRHDSQDISGMSCLLKNLSGLSDFQTQLNVLFSDSSL